MALENGSTNRRYYTEFSGMPTHVNGVGCNATDFATASQDSDQDPRIKRQRTQEMTEATNGSPISPDDHGPVESIMQAQTSTLPFKASNMQTEQSLRGPCTQQAEGSFMVNAELGSLGNGSVSNFMRAENPHVPSTSLGGFGQHQQPVTHEDFVEMIMRLNHLSKVVTLYMEEVRHLTETIKKRLPEVLEMPLVQPFPVPYHQGHPVLPVVYSPGIQGFNVSPSLTRGASRGKRR